MKTDSLSGHIAAGAIASLGLLCLPIALFFAVQSFRREDRVIAAAVSVFVILFDAFMSLWMFIVLHAAIYGHQGG